MDLFRDEKYLIGNDILGKSFEGSSAVTCLIPVLNNLYNSCVYYNLANLMCLGGDILSQISIAKIINSHRSDPGSRRFSLFSN